MPASEIKQVADMYKAGASYAEIIASLPKADASTIQRALRYSGMKADRKPRTTLEEEQRIVEVLKIAESRNWSLNRQALEIERSIGVLLRVAREHGITPFQKPLRGKPLMMARQRGELG